MSDTPKKGIELTETGSTQAVQANIPRENTAEESTGTPDNYIKGLRLHLITAALSLCLFLTNLEIPIVVTALVGITNDLGGFQLSSWIVAAYLLGYVAVLIIFSKLSDIFGRKSVLLIVIGIFIVFSGACGAAQTIQQLIVFRAFQGIGGAGNYSLCSVMFFELVPANEYAKYTSSVSVVYSLSLLLGPIFGGAISQSTTWRWVFLLNVPAGILAPIIIIICVPNGFPHHRMSKTQRTVSQKVFSRATFQKIDFCGAFMLLIATSFLVAALEEAGNKYPWRSAFVIILLTISAITWIAFLLWERRVTLDSNLQEPVFPWRFVQSRIWIGMLLNALFLGAPWFVGIFQLPQRLQVVNSVSPLEAGVRFIPFTLAAPFGSVVAPTIAKLCKVPPIYLVVAASVVQVIGFALLSSLPASQSVATAQYGYEILAGFGCGINITLLILITPFSVEDRDKSVALGSIAQFRVMGGVIGLAIVTAVFNSFVKSKLGQFLSADQIDNLLKATSSITSLPTEMQEVVRGIFADGYNLQMKILAGFAAAQIPSSLVMWQKKQIRV